MFTRYRLQLFLWYELPRKWLVEPDEHLAVAEVLGLFFGEFGPPAAPLVALCRNPETTRLLRAEGAGFVEAIEASGLEPPDTPLLEWSDLMTLEESLEREAVAEMLEQAVDGGHLVPGAPGWRQRQAELVERHLIGADEGNATPLGRLYAARREAWLERVAGDERALLEAATPSADVLPTLAEAESAIEPLLWLLGLLADGVKLTQTGALPRSLVRAAVDRYPRELLANHGIRHLTTEPYRPRTNGKVERFHQTMGREWAHGVRYRSDRHRAQALPHWLFHYG